MKSPAMQPLLCHFLWLLTFAVILSSCNNRGNLVLADNQEEIIKKEVILAPELEDLLYNMPTPHEMMAVLQHTRAPFMANLANKPENVGRYVSQRTKSVNLGIYSVDLAYASLFRRRTETEQMLYCTTKLADDLGIDGTYDKRFVNRLKDQLEHPDTIASLIREGFDKTNESLRRNNRNQVALLVASGAFTEGLYISVSLCQVVKENSPIVAQLAFQRVSIEKLIQILNEYESDPTIKPVADQMAVLQQMFTGNLLPTGKNISPDKVAVMLKTVSEIRKEMVR